MQQDIRANDLGQKSKAGLGEKLNKAGLGKWWPPLAYLLMALALTWPLPLHLTSRIPRGSPDSWQNIWNFWWMRSALFERGANPFQTQVLFYPYRSANNPLDLYYHTLQPTISLPAGLLSSFLGYALTYNLVILVGFVLSGWFTYLLASYTLPTVNPLPNRQPLTQSSIPRPIVNRQSLIPFIVGAFYAFSVYHWHNLGQGQTEVFWLQWIPLYIWLLYQALIRSSTNKSEYEPKLKYALLAGLVLVLTTYCSFYYTLYLLLYTASVYIIMLIWQGKQNWLKVTRQVSLIIGVWLILAGPLIGAMLLNHNDPTILYAEGRQVEILQSAALNSFFVPLRGVERNWQPAFLTYTLLVLAAIGLWRSKWRGLGWATLAVIALTLALGPYLRLDQNQRPEQALNNLPLPYLLFSKIPLINNSRSPIRFMAVAQLGLVMLAAWGLLGLSEGLAKVQNLGRKYATQVVAGLALLTFVLEVNVWPLALQDLPRPAIFQQIAADPDKTFGILELPLGGHYTEDARRMYFQTLHQHSISSGYISRRTEDYDKLAGSPFRQFFSRPFLPADPVFDTGPVAVRLLSFYKIKYVINYRDEYTKDDPEGFFQTEERLGQLFGPGAKVYADDLLTAYRVPQEGGAEPFPVAMPGAYPAQKLENGRNYRWAGQDAALTLALPAPAKIQLQLTAWSFTPENTLEIRLDGRVIGQLKLSSAPTEMQTPPLDLPAGLVTLRFRTSDPARSPAELNQGNDERKLAFALSSVRLVVVS